MHPAATLATFINQEEYNFLEATDEYFMLNMQRDSGGNFVMVDRPDSSFWSTKWAANEPSGADDFYGSMYSDGLLHAFPTTANFGRDYIVCQVFPTN